MNKIISENLDAGILIIERAIIEGSGGPENVPISPAGLRFIRYLLSLLPQHSVLPNFKNMQTIESLARLFVDSCGSINKSVQRMRSIMHCVDGFIDD